jgi:peptide chain release factor subunit 1
MAATANRSSSRRQVGKTARRHDHVHDIPSALAELLALGDLGWVVSCYQKLEPNDRVGDKFRIKLKNRLRKAEDRLGILGFSHDDRESIIETLNEVEAYFRHAPNLAGARGIAVFAGQGWIRAVKLPSVLRSRVIVDRTPVVSELVALTESGSRVLVAVADRTSARMFALSFEGIEELDGLVAPDAPRGKHFTEHGDRTTSGEYKFHNRIREEKQRHLARVADAVTRAYRVRAFDGVVIGGIGVGADALLPHLPTTVRDHVLGVLNLAPKGTTAAVIREKAMELWLDAAGAAQADAVGELAGLLDSGWAVDGVDATLQALSRGQVRTLIVDQDAELAGYRFQVSGRLSRVASASRGEGEAVPLADLLDDAIEDALRQRARVAAVRGGLAKKFDQVAAILRFRTTK